MQRLQVVVTDHLAEIGPERKILDDIADITLLETNDEADLPRRGAHAEVLLVYHTIQLSERSIAALPKCKGIVRCFVGYDNVYLAEAMPHCIVERYAPDYRFAA